VPEIASVSCYFSIAVYCPEIAFPSAKNQSDVPLFSPIDMNDLRLSTEFRAPIFACQSPSVDCDQKHVGFKTMRSQPTHSRGERFASTTSLAQQDFAMRRIFKTRVDVGFFEVGKVLEDLLRRHPAGKHFQHMAHRDSHTARFTTGHPGLIRIRSICMCLFL
jgi:hypothetical protein